jgi:hypothetical protein
LGSRPWGVGPLKPELCNGKIQDLNARLQELEAEKRDLETRRKRLDLPEVDRELLLAVVDEFEKVMAEGTNPQKKDLLRRLVKKVLARCSPFLGPADISVFRPAQRNPAPL